MLRFSDCLYVHLIVLELLAWIWFHRDQTNSFSTEQKKLLDWLEDSFNTGNEFIIHYLQPNEMMIVSVFYNDYKLSTSFCDHPWVKHAEAYVFLVISQTQTIVIPRILSPDSHWLKKTSSWHQCQEPVCTNTQLGSKSKTVVKKGDAGKRVKWIYISAAWEMAGRGIQLCLSNKILFPQCAVSFRICLRA